MTTYTGTIDCSATRIHICQYCGMPFTYPINKSFSTSGQYSPESAVSDLANKRDHFLEHYVYDFKCPICGQYQTSMAYKELSRWCVWRFIAVVILQLIFYSLIFSNLFFYGLEYFIFVLPFWFELFWHYYNINRYYGRKSERFINIDGDTLEEYVYQRGFYQKLKLLLILGFVCSFIPLFGLCIAGCTLLTYYIIMLFLPARFRSQGFPLYCQDVKVDLR